MGAAEDGYGESVGCKMSHAAWQGQMRNPPPCDVPSNLSHTHHLTHVLLVLFNTPPYTHTTPHCALCPQSVLRAWLPLSEAVLGMAAAQLPSPAAAAAFRAPRLLGGPPGGPPPPGLPERAAAELARVEAAVASSDAGEEAPLVVYVSKMVAVPVGLLPRAPGEPAPVTAPGHDEVGARGEGGGG